MAMSGLRRFRKWQRAVVSGFDSSQVPIESPAVPYIPIHDFFDLPYMVPRECFLPVLPNLLQGLHGRRPLCMSFILTLPQLNLLSHPSPPLLCSKAKWHAIPATLNLPFSTKFVACPPLMVLFFSSSLLSHLLTFSDSGCHLAC
jgi:hypothetical protein